MKNSIIALICAVVTMLAAIIIRFFQYVSVIDYSTGFFVEGSGIAGIIIYIIIVSALVIGFIAAAADKKRGSRAFEKTSETLSPSSTLLIGASYVLGGIFFAVSAYNALSAGGFQLISMIAIAAAAFIIGFLLLSHKQIPVSAGYLQLIPTIVLTCHAAVYFTSDLVIKRMSDELISMLADILMVFLCLCLGRFLSGNEAKLTRIKLIAYSVAELTISSALTFGKLLAGIFGGDTVKNIPSIGFEYFAMFVISGAVLIMLYSKKTAKPIEQPAISAPTTAPSGEETAE